MARCNCATVCLTCRIGKCDCECPDGPHLTREAADCAAAKTSAIEIEREAREAWKQVLHWKARAEAAEQRVREVEAGLIANGCEIVEEAEDVLTGEKSGPWVRNTRAEAAEQRVREVEALPGKWRDFVRRVLGQGPSGFATLSCAEELAAAIAKDAASSDPLKSADSSDGLRAEQGKGEG